MTAFDISFSDFELVPIDLGFVKERRVTMKINRLASSLFNGRPASARPGPTAAQ